MASVQQDWRAHADAWEEMGKNAPINMVAGEGYALQYASLEMKNNAPIVMAAA